MVEGGHEILARLPVTALEPDKSKNMQNFLPTFGSTYDWRVFIEVMSVLLDHFCSHFSPSLNLFSLNILIYRASAISPGGICLKITHKQKIDKQQNVGMLLQKQTEYAAKLHICAA